MNSSTRRWLIGFVVVILCLPGAVDAQAVWHPVGSPTHTENGNNLSGGLSPARASPR